jgi:hypothetical protein
MLPKAGVLVKLKNSVRNCALIRSRMLKFFITDTSKFTNPGFARMPAPALPQKLPAYRSALVGVANAAALIH